MCRATTPSPATGKRFSLLVAIAAFARPFRSPASISPQDFLDTPLDILATGQGWTAINKPAGLAAIPGRAETDSVLQRLARQLGLPDSGTFDPRVRVVHRLDKDTTGVMLFATDGATQRHLSHQFQNNTTQKEYLALVAGRPTETDGEVNAALARHHASPERMAIVRHGGRPAITAWRVEQAFRDATLLRVFPKTGKTHQIRVHLQSIGLPLAIDPLYNPPHRPVRGVPLERPAGLYLSDFKRGYRRSASSDGERPLMSRLTLHAEILRFVDLEGADVQLSAPLPKDFRATINMLGKYNNR